MRQLLDKLDPFFAAAIVIAGLTVYSQVPYQIISLDFSPATIINQIPGK